MLSSTPIEVYNVPESFYHERSTKEPSYQRDTSAKKADNNNRIVIEGLWENLHSYNTIVVVVVVVS